MRQHQQLPCGGLHGKIPASAHIWRRNPSDSMAGCGGGCKLQAGPPTHTHPLIGPHSHSHTRARSPSQSACPSRRRGGHHVEDTHVHVLITGHRTRGSSRFKPSSWRVFAALRGVMRIAVPQSPFVSPLRCRTRQPVPRGEMQNITPGVPQFSHSHVLRYKNRLTENSYFRISMEQTPADARAAPWASAPNDIDMGIASSPKRQRDPAQDNKVSPRATPFAPAMLESHIVTTENLSREPAKACQSLAHHTTLTGRCRKSVDTWAPLSEESQSRSTTRCDVMM